MEQYVFESYAALHRTARIKQFLVQMAENFARERLLTLAQSGGHIAKEVPEVLLVCVHNAGRSQMAMALLQAWGEGRVHVRSAGAEPGSEINPAVMEAMSEIRLDLESAYPMPLTDDVIRAADYVITMGCGNACPIYPGKTYLEWELADPAGQDVESVRRIRDEIGVRIDHLLVTIESRA